MDEVTLGRLEYQLLASLLEHPRDAYGVTLMERLEERTGRKRTLAAIYASLDRLREKGMVSSWWGEATSQRGGRRKRLYRIDAAGVEAVRNTERAYAPPAGGTPIMVGS